MFKVLNINKFIKENSVKEVTNRTSFTKEGELTDDGLYSNIIFGSTSKEMSSTFGYITLNATIMHPAILNSISKLSTLFKKIIYSEKKVVINNGHLQEDINGNTGVGWLFNNWNKINFEFFLSEKNADMVDFISNSDRNELFITKWLVTPPKFRMYTEEHGRVIEDELTMIFKNIIGLTNIGHAESGLMQAVLKNSNKDLEIQKAITIAYNFFLEKMEKKEGQFRASLISKRIDNNVRLVANARPDIPFNCAGLPWHVLLNIFDVYIVGSINKKIFEKDYAKLLGTSNFNTTEYGMHFNYIFRNVDTYTDSHKGYRELWVELLKELFEWHPDLQVLLKRDPAWDKGSYHSLYPIIIPSNSFHIVVNSLLYKPLGGDSFNSNIIAFEEAGDIVDNQFGRLFTSDSTIYKLKSLNAKFKEL